MVLLESNRTGRSKAARWSAAEPFLPPHNTGAQIKAAVSWWGWLAACQVLFQLQWLEPAPSNLSHPACAAPLHCTAVQPALPGFFWVRECITPKRGCPLPPSQLPLLPLPAPQINREVLTAARFGQKTFDRKLKPPLREGRARRAACLQGSQEHGQAEEAAFLKQIQIPARCSPEQREL